MKNYTFNNSIKPLKVIREDLRAFQEYWVVLYGSYLTNEYILHRSDIDIAIITQNMSRSENLSLWSQSLGKVSPIYDIRIFELHPLPLQMEIFRNFHVIFGDELEISEYFYQFYKKWKDVAPRIKRNQIHNLTEKRHGLARRSFL